VNDSDATTRRYEHDPMGLVVGARLGKVLINGNGSTIKLKGSGQMHFGSFDPVSGAAVDKTNTDPDEYITYRDYASDIGDLLRFEDCLDVEVTNIILDGNLANQVWGGYYADKGVQCRQSGLYFLLNDNVWVHDNVVCKNNSLDGIGIKNEVADETAPLKYVKIEEVSCQYNGRQGLSYNCGNHLEIYNSDFSYTGRTTVGSPSKILNFPGAGIDLEPIGRYMRAGAVIENCTFFDNREVGLLLTGATPCIVRDCTLWQSTEWTGAGWSPRGGRAIFVYGDTNGDKDEDHFFIRCNVYGQIYNRMGRRLQFEECNFIQANSAFYGPHNQNEPVYSRPAIESPNTGGAMHFDACNVTITQNNASGLTRSVWAYNIVLENSTVHHASYKLNPPSLFVARLYDNFLLNTHFTEAGFSATNRFFIEHDASGTASKIGPGVELTGSHYITWGNTTQTLPISATEPINPNITWKVLTPNPSAGETGVATTATYSVIDNPFTAAVDINPFTNPADPGNTRLFDGDSPDDWNHTAGINWVDQAIDINLHATYNVRSVKIRMKHLVTQRPMRVWVHVGNGTTWTPMGLLRPNERDNATNPDTWYTLTLPATLSGSHVRLVFENEGAWGWYINEVKVYGN
jgi:hypothetical protein